MRALTPAAAYAARASATVRRPAWCQTSGRVGFGQQRERRRHRPVQDPRALAAADDHETAPLRAARAEQRCARRRRSRRTSCARACRSPRRARDGGNVPGNDVKIRAASGASNRFVVPATAFGSCSISGLRASHAATPPGPATNPPMPNTAAGRRRRSAAKRLRARRRQCGTARRATRVTPRPRTPAIEIHSTSMPCCGTSRASRPRCVPSHTTLALPRTQLVGDGEPREDVAARAARHDHDRAAAHRTCPRCTRRFCPP